MGSYCKTASDLWKKVGTGVVDTAETFAVSYRGTTVYSRAKEKNALTFNTGGWFTATTKSRMNDAARVDGIYWRVFQDGGKWFAQYRDYKRIPFAGDSLTVRALPGIVGEYPCEG